jgi:hypothetical protein
VPPPAGPGSTATGPYVTPWPRLYGPLRRLLQTLCALAPLLLIWGGLHPAIAAIPALYPLFILIRRGERRLRRHPSLTSLDGESGIRILLGLLPGAVYATGDHTSALGWVTMALVALLPLGEPLVARVAPGRKLRVANLPGIPDHRRPVFPINLVLLADLLASVVTTGLLLLAVPGGALLPVPIIAVALMVVFMADVLRRVRSSISADNELFSAVDAYAPTFVLYYGVATGSEYQVKMWMEYLERIGEPFIVILRHRSTFGKIRGMTDVPVVARTSMRQLDDVMVPSVTTAFYVNNSAVNAHLVRYPEITHVQLLHGDSDKATSFNPITAMFDKIFVAGQAGIDRYANNGVDIPAQKFEIVGRPQVEAVAHRTEANIPVRTVLYAPTWEGHFADTNYGSLAVGPVIVRALLARGIRVIFRPHPYSYRNPEASESIRTIKDLLAYDRESGSLEHLWGTTAEKEMSVFDCFNAADAMISDVSSVVPDFLYSGKPYSVVCMQGATEDFASEFPLAGAAYVISRDLSDLDEALDDLLLHDRKEEQRRQTRRYYLGDFPPEHYADGFLDAARALIHRHDEPAAAGDTSGTPMGAMPDSAPHLEFEDDPADEPEDDATHRTAMDIEPETPEGPAWGRPW